MANVEVNDFNMHWEARNLQDKASKSEHDYLGCCCKTSRRKIYSWSPSRGQRTGGLRYGRLEDGRWGEFPESTWLLSSTLDNTYGTEA